MISSVAPEAGSSNRTLAAGSSTFRPSRSGPANVTRVMRGPNGSTRCTATWRKRGGSRRTRGDFGVSSVPVIATSVARPGDATKVERDHDARDRGPEAPQGDEPANGQPHQQRRDDEIHYPEPGERAMARREQRTAHGDHVEHGPLAAVAQGIDLVRDAPTVDLCVDRTAEDRDRERDRDR